MGARRVAVVCGTRPEAIKIAPVAAALAEADDFEPIVLITGQHRQMLDSVLGFFDLRADHDLDLFRRGQSLSGVLSRAVAGISDVLRVEKPDVVLVQGDTTTTLASTIAAVYERIPVGHVEAGLRTHDISAPFPEELNRRMTTHATTWHFAPTEAARDNLLAEGILRPSITVTGNTVIDALVLAAARPPSERVKALTERFPGHRLVLVTAHRRESWGEGLRNIARALAAIASDPTVLVVFPVHGNPIVRHAVEPVLGDLGNVRLTEPLDYGDFVQLMKEASLILSDSGGVQEEAPFLGTPVLILREVTERPEAVEWGGARLVGTDVRLICDSAREVLANPQAFGPEYPYVFGDGRAASRILEVLRLSAGHATSVPEFDPFVAARTR